MNGVLKDGDTVVMKHPREVLHVTKSDFRVIAMDEGWDEKTVDLFLKPCVIDGKQVGVTAPVPCGRYALVVDWSAQ